jgi:hypothetical protein
MPACRKGRPKVTKCNIKALIGANDCTVLMRRKATIYSVKQYTPLPTALPIISSFPISASH